MDAFSEVLSGVRLKGAMFFSAEFSAPWQLSTPHSRTLASTLAPGAQHTVIYHFVVMQAGGGGPTTRFVCGYLTLDPLLCGPILESLPPMLKVNVRTDRSGHWLEQSILHLLEEAASDRAGSDAMLAKLS